MMPCHVGFRLIASLKVQVMSVSECFFFFLVARRTFHGPSFLLVYVCFDWNNFFLGLGLCSIWNVIGKKEGNFGFKTG